MVHGMLADEGGEFFIRPREPSETPGSTAPQQQQQDDTSRLPDKGPQGAALPTGVRRLMQQRTEDDTYKDWHEAFEVGMSSPWPLVSIQQDISWLATTVGVHNWGHSYAASNNKWQQHHAAWGAV